jgi:hypothetical protein
LYGYFDEAAAATEAVAGFARHMPDTGRLFPTLRARGMLSESSRQLMNYAVFSMAYDPIGGLGTMLALNALLSVYRQVRLSLHKLFDKELK